MELYAFFIFKLIIMTRDKAAELLQQGYILRHERFLPEEFIHIKQGKLVTEDDYDFHEQFWTLSIFKSGWSVVK
jgi:hypothetical protein